MATPRGRPEPPVERQLFEEPYRFEVFQAVRLLERLRPGRAPVGREGAPRREAVRFRAHASLAFPPSQLQKLQYRDDDPDVLELTVAFLGLVGPLGVLPYCYTELVIDRLRARPADDALAQFLDLFHHRLISLFVRAWQKYRPAIAHERDDDPGIEPYLFDLMGLGTAGLRGRHEFADAALLYFAGALARRQRPAVMLERLLAEQFGVPVRAEQFVGQWLRLEPDDRSSLGASGQHNALGADLILGARVRDEQGKFRLRLGPLGFAAFQEFAPDGRRFRALAQLARLYVEGGLEFDVQLVLRADEVPASRLGPAPDGARLGRHAWLISRPPARDAGDAIFAAGA